MGTARVAEQVVGIGAMPDRHGWILSDQTLHPGLARFRSTSNGAQGATTSTIVSTALTGTTADQYVGQLVCCMGPYTSRNFLMIRRIILFVPATDTATVDLLPTQTLTDDAWEGWDDGSSVFVDDAGGAQPISDATRDEAADFWSSQTGDHAVSSGGTNGEGPARPVSTFTSPSLTLASAMPNTVHAVGDLFDVMAFPLWAETPEFERDYGEINVEAQRGGSEAFDEEPHLVRVPSWRGRCAVNWKGSGTPAGDGTLAPFAPDSYRMMAAMFDAVRSTGEAIVAGSSVSVVKITNATAAQFPAGSPALHAASGRLAMAISTGAGGGGDDDVNLQPYLDRAPASGEVLFGGVAWYPKVTGHGAVVFDEWDDAMRWRYYGGVPNVEIDHWGIGQKPMLKFAYEGGPFWGCRKAITLAPQFSTGVTRDTVRPNGLTNSRIILFSAGANLDLLCVDLKVNYQVERVRQVFANLPMGHYATTVTKVTPVVSVSCKVDRASPNDTMYELERMLNEGLFAMLAQGNQLAGHTIGWYAHQVQWSGPRFRASNGLREIEITGKVKRSGVSGLGPCALVQA